jgi:2-keto-4-pentenoate hydratase
MNVAEAEFAFRFRRALPPRALPYQVDEVLDAIDSLHPAVEVPDSRYKEFAKVGAPQLIADFACACWFVLGPATRVDWRSRDLVSHPVKAYINDQLAATGAGANVLGDPRTALTWIVNELATFGGGIRAGQFVTTGTCVVPPTVHPGDAFRADFGEFGEVEVRLA